MTTPEIKIIPTIQLVKEEPATLIFVSSISNIGVLAGATEFYDKLEEHTVRLFGGKNVKITMEVIA